MKIEVLRIYNSALRTKPMFEDLEDHLTNEPVLSTGLFGCPAVGGSEEVGSRIFFFFWKMRSYVSFPVFRW